MRCDLPAVPIRKDFLQILEILVERRTPNAGFMRNARHREAVQALRRRQGGCAVHDGVSYRIAVGFNRVVPELGHSLTIAHRGKGVETICS